MGKRTSIYLADDVAAGLKASGETGNAVLRRGLGLERPDVALARRAAVDALESLGDELQDRIDRAVERALRKMQGG